MKVFTKQSGAIWGKLGICALAAVAFASCKQSVGGAPDVSAPRAPEQISVPAQKLPAVDAPVADEVQKKFQKSLLLLLMTKILSLL